MCCLAYIKSITNSPFDHPTRPLSLVLYFTSLLFRQMPFDSLVFPVVYAFHVSFQTASTTSAGLPTHKTNPPISHQPSNVINGPSPRLSHTSHGNANSNADDLLHLHHHAPLHHRMETDDSISLRLDLPLPHPALHSLPSFAGGKMQFARFLASSGPSWKNKGSGAGVVMLCRRRSWRGRRR
jgi:hypothetical protein